MIGIRTTKLILAVGFLAGCASPEVVEITRTTDFDLSCAELRSGISDAERFRESAQGEKGATGTNVAAVLFFWPALLVTYNNIDEATRAAEERKSHLTAIYQKKGCVGGTATAAATPAATPDGADYYDGLRAYEAGHHTAAATAWEVAAKANDAKAQYRLGEMHQSGQGVPQSFVKAHQYFNLAAAQGHAESQAARDALAQRMTPEDISRAQKLAENWRTVQAQPRVAALGSGAGTETSACGPVATDVTSSPRLKRALFAYYKKHPIHLNYHNQPRKLRSIEKMRVVKTSGRVLTIDVKYRAAAKNAAYNDHRGTAKVEVCGSTYKILSFA